MEDVKKNPLEDIPDTTLFEEVAARLKRLFRAQHGLDFIFGAFEFTFHDGRFQYIEERPMFRRYRSLGRNAPMPT
jgi:hypothetical protein